MDALHGLRRLVPGGDYRFAADRSLSRWPLTTRGYGLIATDTAVLAGAKRAPWFKRAAGFFVSWPQNPPTTGPKPIPRGSRRNRVGSCRGFTYEKFAFQARFPETRRLTGRR